MGALLCVNKIFFLNPGLSIQILAWGGDPSEVQKVVNTVILDDRKYIQNQGLAENISKT